MKNKAILKLFLTVMVLMKLWEDIYISVKPPDSIDFDKECRRLLKDIHYFDVLRSDRSISSWIRSKNSIFGYRSFVEYYLSISHDILDVMLNLRFLKNLLLEKLLNKIIPNYYHNLYCIELKKHLVMVLVIKINLGIKLFRIMSKLTNLLI